MKKLHRILYLLMPFCLVNLAYGAETSLVVNQIIVGPQASDPANKFSLNMNFTNTLDSIDNWQIGFYMPRSFRQTSVSNRKLSMQICQTGSKICAQLNYQKPTFLQNDLSTVFTTILAPASVFPIQKGKSYTISLLHNSSRGPLNISALPQSWFITTPEDFIRLKTNRKTYQITNYDSNKTQQSIQEHISANWLNSTTKQESISIIPTPTSVKLISDTDGYIFSKTTELHNRANLSPEQIKLWSSALNQDLKISLNIDTKDTTEGISLEKVSKQDINNPEAYRLTISSKQIIIQASDDAGFFYALMTLRQLWFQLDTPLPAMEIYDAPRFKYRGILLDVARHYLTVPQIKNFIDVMAAAKLNTLHWHLSDDEAFRVNLPDFPELANIGAARGLNNPIGPMSMIQKNLSVASESLPNANQIYGQSYTPEQIKDLVNYANTREITIIPEIDIPGHSRALMKALPNSFYEKGDPSEYAGYGDDVLPVCAYNDLSKFGQRFKADLVSIMFQITQLFNHQTTPYAIDNELSIGGDEVFKGTWDNSPSCQKAPWNKFNTRDKEHYFLDLFNDSAKINRLKLSGWHEFVIDHNGKIDDTNGVDASEIGHVWVWSSGKEAIKQAVTLANNNFPVVMDYAGSLYFDMAYTPALSEPGFYWSTRFGDTYAALNSGIKANSTLSQTKAPQNILGLEGTLWTDVIPDYAQLQYMAFPKIAGLSEAAWSNLNQAESQPNWQSLARRLGCGQSGFLAYLHSAYNVTYRGYPNGIAKEAPQLCH